MSMPLLKLAVVGCNTAAGLLETLSELKLPLAAFYPLDRDDEGELVSFGGEDWPVMALGDFNWASADVAIFLSQTEAIADALAAGCKVVDASNGEPQRGAVQVPNVIDVLLARLVGAFKAGGELTTVTATGLLAVSQEGQPGIDKLSEQTRAIFAQQAVEVGTTYAKRIAFNLVPQEQQAVTARAAKLSRKLGVPLSLQLAHVPVFYGHSLSVAVQFAQPVTAAALQAAFTQTAGIYLLERGVASPQDAIGGEQVWVSQLAVAEDGLSASAWAVVDNSKLSALLTLAALQAALEAR
ncbi:Aspartate-semialdehyde dehydrogenase [Andreprevotia lacus DSM 23236]|jgi:aspartate-semialdehyde dehydrogenase|uniref:Aspartate-semialdehyde dehydrogenase n=1 Tax=Andreprevotia lacus DSM 23236 TaxID=1121001 RepID=A0A1W1XFQ9_9NEIS|nr:Asd/ArgC dimerization domain-containing protein [Andreprevotia lacus]SMC22351.1 Aspartate-semialdehyde dehydrogenase [Andreprevotia lacus DSM 23236]